MGAERRPRRWLRLVFLFVALVVVAVLVLRAALPGLARDRLVEILGEQLNLDLDVAAVDLDLQDGRATLGGVRIDLEGRRLASIVHVDVQADVRALLRGEQTTIRLDLIGLEGEIRVEEDGALNLARIAPRTPRAAPDPAEPPSPRILLDFHARGAQIRFEDHFTDPARPLDLALQHASIAATQVLAQGPAVGAPSCDVRLLGSIPQDGGPALLGAGAWWSVDEHGRDLELHAALTAFDVRGTPQYVTPQAGTILGGDVMHASATMVARDDRIESGLVEIEVEDSSSDLALRFGGPLGAPVFDVDSPVLEAFRLSYLRVGDTGSRVFATGKRFGATLWDRSAGFVSETAGGVGAAVTEAAPQRLLEGLWKGVKGLFTGSDEDDREERIERWKGFARRQLAFRELFMRRRLEVAREREPGRVPEFEALLARHEWDEDVRALVPEADRPDVDAAED